MYAINVRINMAGDFSFSYMHNLLKDLLFNTYKLCQSTYTDCQISDSIRFLTLASIIISSSMIFLTIKKISNDTIISLAGTIFWLIIPGNILLVHLNEDNVWAASYTCIFIFAAVNIHKTADKGLLSLCTWVFVAASSLSVGINIHQQLSLLFYLFFLLILSHYRITASKKLISLLVFCICYLLLSAIQNTFAFNHPYLKESIIRLYHNPYASIFPELWFFTSGLTLADWFSLILAGWKKTLFFPGKNAPAVYYLFIIMFFLFLFTTIIEFKKSKLFTFTTLKEQIWLALFFLIFIPYSLLYEPQNIERWDSTLPGLTIVIFSTFNIIMHYFSKRFKKETYFLSLIKACLIVFLSISCLQSYTFISNIRKTHDNDLTTVNLQKIVTYLKNLDHVDTSILLLSDGFRKWDTDSQILLFYPSIRFITLRRGTLQPIHSSYPLQNIDFTPNLQIPDEAFPKGSRFIVTPSIYNDLEKLRPEFLHSNHVSILNLN